MVGQALVPRCEVRTSENSYLTLVDSFWSALFHCEKLFGAMLRVLRQLLSLSQYSDFYELSASIGRAQYSHPPKKRFPDETMLGFILIALSLRNRYQLSDSIPPAAGLENLQCMGHLHGRFVNYASRERYNDEDHSLRLIEQRFMVWGDPFPSMEPNEKPSQKQKSQTKRTPNANTCCIQSFQLFKIISLLFYIYQ